MNSRYPSADVARFDQQFAETEYERSARWAKKRAQAKLLAGHGPTCSAGRRAAIARGIIEPPCTCGANNEG